MGLATSAGLNAYIPLLAIGVLTRYTDLIDPPSGWHWLSNPWMLLALAVLLVIELIADKIPAVDHVNDVIQTLVRPTSGGLAFGAAASAKTVTVSDPSTFLDNRQWIPVAIGIALALAVHAAKATTRVVLNATTFGIGAPVASVAEDGASLTLAIVAILLPILVVVFLIGFVALFWWALRLRRRRAQRHAAADRPGDTRV